MHQPAGAPARLEFIPGEYEDLTYVSVDSGVLVMLVTAAGLLVGVLLWFRRRQRRE